MNLKKLIYFFILIFLFTSCNDKQNKIDYDLDAKKLISDFNENILKAKVKYNNKNLRVKGFIYDINEDSLNQKYLILSGEATRGGIKFYFQNSNDPAILKVKKYEHVIIKGICKGKKNNYIILYNSVFDKKNSSEKIIDDLSAISYLAHVYYTKPISLGGGANSFNGWKIPKELEKTVNGHYSFEISTNGNSIKIIGI